MCCSFGELIFKQMFAVGEKKKIGVGLLNVSLQLGVVRSSKAHVVKVWAPGFVGGSGTCKQVGSCEGIFGSWEGFT